MSDRVPDHIADLLAQSLIAWRVAGTVVREEAGSLSICAGEKCLRVSRAQPGLPFRWMVAEGGRTRGVTSIAGLLRAMRTALDPSYRPARLRIAPLPVVPP